MVNGLRELWLNHYYLSIRWNAEFVSQLKLTQCYSEHIPIALRF